MYNKNNNSESYPDSYNPFASNELAYPPVSKQVNLPIFTPSVRPSIPSNSNTDEIKPMNEINLNAKARKVLEEDLENREKELKRRISELEKRETEILSEDRRNNFPAFPKCFPCKSCFYQDFDVDFSDNTRSTVKFGYFIWLIYSFILLVNIFGTMSYMIVKKADTASGSTFGIAILLFILLCPLSYVLWFRPLYNCLRSQSTLNFFILFGFLTINIILSIIQCLGINWLGSCGWLNSLTTLEDNLGVAIFMLIIAIGFTFTAIFQICLLVQVHRLYRKSDLSPETGKAELRQAIKTSIYS